MKVLVTVKAYPGLGQTAGEAVCVAGVRVDEQEPSWVRLWPVGFRELPASAKFKKWQVIEVQARSSPSDTRPESLRPDVTTLKLLDTIDTRANWGRRREMLGRLVGETTLCRLVRQQRAGDVGAPSLGLVKVRSGASASVVDGPVWTADKKLLADIQSAPNLFREEKLAPLRPSPFQIRYQWQCMDEECQGHTHSSCDWEVGAAALRWQRSYSDVRPHLLKKFGDDILGEDKDTYFFVGNQHLRPSTFLVLGAFYPKAAPF